MDFSPKDFIAGYVTPILVLVTALFGFFNNQKATELDQAIKQIELKNKHIFDSLLVIEKSQKLEEFDREFKFKIYEDVKQAVIDGNERVQFVTADFIAVMVEDEVFRDALLKSLISSKNTSDNLKKVLQENLFNETTFQIEQKSLKADLNKLSKAELAPTGDTTFVSAKVRVDIFYLEETNSNYNSLDKAKEFATKLDENRFEVRVRVLPKLTNTKKGYSISQNQIRYEKTETSIAQEINRALEGQFVLNQIDYHTSNYVSVFVYN